MVSQFNKSEPQEPINPTPGVAGMLSVINSVFGETARAAPTDEYFRSFEPSLNFL